MQYWAILGNRHLNADAFLSKGNPENICTDVVDTGGHDLISYVTA